jgi:MFS family permease
VQTPAVAERSDWTAPVRRNRPFRLLLAGSSVSMLGSRVTTIAYPMLVLYLTGSPVTAGWVAFAATAPSVLIYMPAGALVDRSDPRLVMLLSEFGRGIAIGTVAVTVAVGRPSISLLVGMAVIEEILEVFSTLAERRYVRCLVEPAQASSAQVRIEARTHAVVLAGRPLGGFLFEVDPLLPFFFDAASFIISVGALLGIRRERSAVSSLRHTAWFSFRTWEDILKFASKKLMPLTTGVPDRQLRDDIREGLTWLLQNRFARTAVTLSAVTTLICQALIMILLAAARSQHLSSLSVGIALAATGAGGVVGSVAASRWKTPAWCSWIQFQMCIWSVAFIILAISSGRFFLGTAIGMMIILGFSGALGNIEIDTYLMQHVAVTMQARVASVNRLISFTCCAIGPVVGGILVHRYGMRAAIFSLFVMTAALALISVINPSIRSRGSYAPGPLLSPEDGLASLPATASPVSPAA